MTLAPLSLRFLGGIAAGLMFSLVGSTHEPAGACGAVPAAARDGKPSGGAAVPVDLADLQLPPVPEGVTALSFREFFKLPVGPRGLEVTDGLRRLDGKRVRLVGHMVLQTDPTPGAFLLAPQPVKLHEHEYGFADELPASTVHVFLPTNAPLAVRYTPGPLLLTGMLAVGARAEADGRTSLVRLFLDPPTAEQLARRSQAVARPGAPSEAGRHDAVGHAH
jgi:hypothetical protein